MTPEQGGQLTDIEMFINKMIPEEKIEGFEAYAPRPPKSDAARRRSGSRPRPVFGRRRKKYSNRL